MTSPPDPPSQHQIHLAKLSETITELQQKADLSTIISELDSLSTSIQRLGQTFQKRLSAASYRYVEPTQALIEQAQMRFHEATAGLRDQIARHAESLRAEAGSAASLLPQLQKLVSSSDLFASTSARLEALTAAVNKRVEETTSALRGQYEPFRAAVSSLERHINDAAEALKAAGEARLELQAGESLVTGCKAEWVQFGRGGDDPDGMLYLTDQRLIFVQDEKKGKMLGLFGGKQVQDELWSVPLTHIQSLETERKGIIGGKAMVTLRLAPGAAHSELVLEIKGGFGNDRLVEYVERIRAGNFAPPVTLPEITLTVPPPAPAAQAPAIADKPGAPSLGSLESKHPGQPVKPGLSAAPDKPSSGLSSLTAAAAAAGGKPGTPDGDLTDLAVHLKMLKTSTDPKAVSAAWEIIERSNLKLETAVMEAVIEAVVKGNLSYRDVCMKYAEVGAYKKLIGPLDEAVEARASSEVKLRAKQDREALGKL